VLVALLLALLAAPPGTIRARVEGSAREVVAYRDGIAVARAPVAGGTAFVEGLEPGAYDLRAESESTASEVVRGVRAVTDQAKGIDATLHPRKAHRVHVKTAPDARVWTSGLSLAPPVLLPEGMHRIVVDHPTYVSSAERWVRVAGPTTIEVPLEHGLEIRGIVAAKETPVAGASVEVLADGIPARRATVTDAQGNFAVSGFRGDVISLRVTAPGFADRLQRVLFDPFAERARAEVGLDPGSSVTLDAPGEAILLPAWYEAALEEPRLRCNHVPARGAGRFDGLIPGRRYAILVQAPGFRPARTETFEALAAGLTLRLGKFALEPAATLRGRIQGGSGGTVVCDGPEGTLTCRADRQGRFEFTGLDPGEHILWVRDLDETGTPVTLAIGETREMDLVCTPPPADRELKGFVFDADSKPLPGVVVEAAGRRAVTGDDGAFRLDPLPRGPARFAVAFVPGPGCRGLVADPHLPFTERKAAPGTEVRVQLERAGTLRLTLDPGERTLARATLLASGATGLKLSRALPYRASEVAIDDLPVGRYVVDVAAPGVSGTGGAVVEVTAAPGAPSVVKVLPGRTIRGKVLLRKWIERPGAAPSPYDTPAAQGFVALLDGDPLRAPCVVPLDPDGTFVLDGVPDGPVLLAAAVPGFPVAVAPGDAPEIAVEEEAEAAVVVTGEGEPLPDARVRFATPQGIDIRDLSANGRFRGVVAGDEDFDDVLRSFRLDRTSDGRIAAAFLQPGSYRVFVSVEGWEPAQLGVRARTATISRRIREEVETSFPSGPPDLASPVRLTRAKR
jgi:Carboxypeptidase regulatory-like domain